MSALLLALCLLAEAPGWEAVGSANAIPSDNRPGFASRNTRGPLSLGRLTRCDDGKVRYTMKRVIRGKQDLVMTGLELVEKLAVLVPPPRVNLVRYHGCSRPARSCARSSCRTRLTSPPLRSQRTSPPCNGR